MNHQLCVLLYSKYSPRCKQIVGALHTAPVNLMSVIGLTLVCVDNEDIRSKIQSATSVEVSSVPTVLMVYNNGGVEKYEGERAFMWVDQTVKQLAPPPPPAPAPPPAPSPPPAPPAPPPTPPKKKEKVTERKKEPPQRKKMSTDIEDLDTESEDEDEGDGRPHPPPVGVRKGAGEYEISRSFGERVDQNRDLSSHTNSGSTDLMVRAQAMQKEREASANKSRRSG